MTLREMILKLLERPLSPQERKMLELVLEVNPEQPVEGTLYPAVEAHIRGRFEWFYHTDGSLRQAA